MAETAAHYTTTNENKPSLFEVIAQKSLNSTLFPALHKISEFLALCHPHLFSSVPQYSDEIFLVLKCLLDYSYLFKRDATFSEYFYSLKRVSVTTPHLPNHKKYLSLLLGVVVPYLKRKFDDKMEQIKLQTLEGTCKSQSELKFKKNLIIIYSSCEMFWNTWFFVQYFKYITNKSPVQSPELYLIGLKLVYSEEIVDSVNFWSSLFKGQLSLSETISGLFYNCVCTGLEISAFFLQFLKVWNSERLNYDFKILPKVPPPSLDSKSQMYYKKCPLCLQTPKIPTVIPVSGYVFCFTCILRHLKEKNCCPVTNLPAKFDDLVRIYD